MTTNSKPEEPRSRIARALRLLGAAEPNDATSLADAIWLAQFLPIAVETKTPERKEQTESGKKKREKKKRGEDKGSKDTRS